MSDVHASGDERIGAEALFRAHAQFVASFLYRFGAPSEDIDDMVQEVFIVAHRKGGYIRGAAQPRTWLAAIAIHVAQTARRTRKRRERNVGTSDESLEHMPTDVDPHQELENRRAIECLQRVLGELPPEHRAAFVLYEIEGESCESIAAQWQVPIGTVYSRLHSARRRVFEAYADQSVSSARLGLRRRALQHLGGEP